MRIEDKGSVGEIEAKENEVGQHHIGIAQRTASSGNRLNIGPMQQVQRKPLCTSKNAISSQHWKVIQCKHLLKDPVVLSKHR